VTGPSAAWPRCADAPRPWLRRAFHPCQANIRQPWFEEIDRRHDLANQLVAVSGGGHRQSGEIRKPVHVGGAIHFLQTLVCRIGDSA